MNERKLAEMKERVARLDGQIELQTRQIRKTLKALKKNYGIENTKQAKARQKELEKQITKYEDQTVKLMAEAKELLDAVN